jgi:putative transposase
MSLLDRRPLFASEDAARVVVNEFQFYRKRSEIELYGYVVMPDHVHAILKLTPPLLLSNWIRRFKTYVGRSLGHGPIWQTGSWTELVPDEEFLRQKLQYVHENPVRRGMVLRAEDYPWSSAREYFVKTTFELIDSYRG